MRISRPHADRLGRLNISPTRAYQAHRRQDGTWAKGQPPAPPALNVSPLFRPPTISSALTGAVGDPVARMWNDLVTYRETFGHLGDLAVPMTDLDGCQNRTAIAHPISRPALAASEQGAQRNPKCVLAAPNDDAAEHPVVVSKPRPDAGCGIQIEERADPLLLDAESRNLGKPSRFNAA